MVRMQGYTAVAHLLLANLVKLKNLNNYELMRFSSNKIPNFSANFTKLFEKLCWKMHFPTNRLKSLGVVFR